MECVECGRLESPYLRHQKRANRETFGGKGKSPKEGPGEETQRTRPGVFFTIRLMSNKKCRVTRGFMFTRDIQSIEKTQSSMFPLSSGPVGGRYIFKKVATFFLAPGIRFTRLFKLDRLG